MTYLADTHALIWAMTDDRHLGADARKALLSGSPVFVSAVTAYEIGWKFRLGRWPEVAEIVSNYRSLISAARFRELACTSTDMLKAADLHSANRDPFDRMIAAQAIRRRLTVLTADPMMADLVAAVVW